MDARIIEDTRQQAGKHARKHAWWAAHGVEVVRRKLDFGDYVAPGSNVSVDTKRSISELAMDVGRDHARFAREMDRARAAGWRLVVLVEAGHPYRTLADLAGWTSDVCRRCEWRRAGVCDPATARRCISHRGKPLQGPQVAAICRSMSINHGVIFEFARPCDSARLICDLLGVTYKTDGQT